MSEPSVLSLLPALVAIFLAFWSRQVLVALFAGVVTGGLVLALQTGELADANFITRFFLPALGSEDFARILLIYLWCLGGLLGIWERTGAALYAAERVGDKLAKSPRTSLLFAWVLGVIFHQGGTVSTVMVGTTVKPISDRHRVSHEALAYVVDSTASPVATLLPFNAWPVFIGGLAAGTLTAVPDAQAGVELMISSIPFNFYSILAVSLTLAFSLGWLPWVPPSMAASQRRALETGALDAPGAEPMLVTDDPAVRADDARDAGYRPALVDFLAPIGVLMGVSMVPWLLTGANLINEAFFACVLTAMGVALARGMSARGVIDGFLDGCRSMTIGAVILGLALTMGEVTEVLHAADFLIGTLGDALPAVALPAALTALCMVMAFATGTSWGTFAVVVPVALPLAWALCPELLYVQVCFGAVLGGAVFGDQCSPISDTTILSSMFTGCDLMDHVRTQLPMALMAAAVATACSTLAAVWAVG